MACRMCNCFDWGRLSTTQSSPTLRAVKRLSRRPRAPILRITPPLSPNALSLPCFNSRRTRHQLFTYACLFLEIDSRCTGTNASPMSTFSSKFSRILQPPGHPQTPNGPNPSQNFFRLPFPQLLRPPRPLRLLVLSVDLIRQALNRGIDFSSASGPSTDSNTPRPTHPLKTKMFAFVVPSNW